MVDNTQRLILNPIHLQWLTNIFKNLRIKIFNMWPTYLLCFKDVHYKGHCCNSNALPWVHTGVKMTQFFLVNDVYIHYHFANFYLLYFKFQYAQRYLTQGKKGAVLCCIQIITLIWSLGWSTLACQISWCFKKSCL